MAYGDGYHGGYGTSTYPDGVRIEVDWTKSGTYTDETQYVRPTLGAVTSAYGRDQTTALAPTVSGQGSVTLDNSTRRFSSRAATLASGAANPLYGSIKPARPVKITRTISATDYLLFTGHTDDQPINPDVDSKIVGLSLVDWLADFRGQTISTPLYRGIRTGQAIGYILDAAGWSSSLRSIDAGATMIPWWWEEDTDALTALDKVVRSEGPPALLSVGGDGTIVFRDRHHRLLDSPSITSQGTWRGSGSVEPVMQRGYSYNEGWSTIVNTGSASVDVRTPQELQAVWTNDSTVSLSAGEQRLFTVSTTDPFMNAVPPVAGTDYQLLSGAVTTTLTRTSGISTAIVVTASTAAVITGLQLRAEPVTVAYAVQVSSSNPSSIADFGSCSFQGDLPWASVYDAEAVLFTAVAQRAQPLPIIQTRFLVGVNTTKAALVLTRDLSDRVTVVEPETAVNGDFYVESISHLLTGTVDHEVTFGLEAVPTLSANAFRLDTAGAGCDGGILSAGLDDPSNVLILDSAVAAHCLDAGVLGT